MLKNNDTNSALPVGMAEYRSSLGIKFRYPIIGGSPDSLSSISIREEQNGNIIIFPANQPEFFHIIDFVKKDPNISIKDAITSVISKMTDIQCKISVTEYASVFDGQLRFSIGVDRPEDIDISKYDVGSCMSVAMFAQYNPKRPDVFIIFVIGHDSFLDENSLELEIEDI